jgi:F0F1-type ATP synthase delta subunit
LYNNLYWRRVIVSSFDINFVEKLKGFLVIQHTPSNKKLDILLSIFPGLTVTMKSFLKVLTERTHLSLIPEISDEYTRILLKFQKCSKVKNYYS